MSITVDVLLICALKDEYDQVCMVTDGLLGTGWVEKNGPRGWTVADGTFATPNGADLRIRATWSDRMGRESTQSVASMLIHEQPARCLAMSGICAGRRNKVALGDVIFAERMWSYDAGKLVVEDDEEYFQGDDLQYRPSPVWVQRIQQVSVAADAPWLAGRPALPLEHQEDWVLLRILANEDPKNHADFKHDCPNWDETIQRLWRRKWLDESLSLTPEGRTHTTKLKTLYPQSLPAPPGFQVHVAPMATGAAVIEDAGIFPRLAKSMRKVLGIEMEGSALAALGEVHDVPVVVAKGVSDFGDTFKDDRYRHFAARAAAECLISLLRSAVDLLPDNIGASTVAQPVSESAARLPRDLIHLLAEEYPDVRDARALWQRAGGKAGEVENISRPGDLWQRLWQRSTQGASVTPLSLLQAALEDLPNNSVLTHHLAALNENET